jgi:protocatechuate 3,4-dioxygenase beta subunit
MRTVVPAVVAFAAGLAAGAAMFSNTAETVRVTKRAAPTPRGGETAEREMPAAATSPEVRQLVARARKPELPPATGRITGRVLDEQDNPVEGIRISARPTAHSSRPTRRRRFDPYGPPKPPDLDAAALDAVEYALWNAAVRKSTMTDADGRYALEGLLDAKYRVSGAAQLWEVRPVDYPLSSAARPGAEVDFVARPSFRFEVTVLGPGGGEVDRARLTCRRDGKSNTRTWTPEQREVRIPLDGERWTVRAESAVYGKEQPRSDPVEIVAKPGGAPEPVILRLREPSGVRATVALPEGIVAEGLRFRLRRLGAREKVDPSTLATGNDVKHGSPRNEGVCTWVGLEPDRYLVGVGWGGEFLEPLAHAVVDVRDGITDCELAVPRPGPDRTRAIVVRGPDGGILRDHVSLLRSLGEAPGKLNRPLPWLRREDGSLLVHMRATDFSAGGKDPQFLSVYHAKLGRARVSLDPLGKGTLEVRFDAAVPLVVAVEGWNDLGLEGRVSASVKRAGIRRSQPVRADGEAAFERIQPGRYEVQLWLRGGVRQCCLAGIEADISSETPRVTLRVPPLHPVRIRCPDFEPGVDIFVWRLDKSGWFAHMAKLTDERTLEFDAPPGKYRATGPRTARLEFDVTGATDVTLK